MFGYPCSFVNGNLWIGLHEENLLLRLDDENRSALLELPEARPFEPLPGRVMREYVVVPPALLEDPAELRPWVKRAFANALALPVKAPKAKKAPAKKAPAKKTAAKKTPKKAPAKKTAAKKAAKKTRAKK